MDLYQIFMAYNPALTVEEIICFFIVITIAIAGSHNLLRKRKITLSQAVAGLLLIVFLGQVFRSTVFTRIPKSYHSYNLELFWSWKKVANGNKVLLKENLLNCILLFPMGLLLPVMFHKKLSWWKGLLMGVLVSAIIETSQLIFCRGLFEWDDMIHNGTGCMIGCVISNWLIRILKAE